MSQGRNAERRLPVSLALMRLNKRKGGMIMYGENNKATLAFALPDGTQVMAMLTFIQLQDNGDRTTSAITDQMTEDECWASLSPYFSQEKPVFRT